MRVLLVALGMLASASIANAAEMFAVKAKFSLPIVGDIAVKNQIPLKGRGGKEYVYGDTCTPESQGEFTVLARHDRMVYVRYDSKLIYDRNGCPSGTISALSLAVLEDLVRRINAEEDLKLQRMFEERLGK